MSIIYINPFQFAAPAGGYDADAQAYITAVEAADGQSLETAVKDAINAFFVGCKTDGNFSALKATCILAGARTRTGALVPLLSSMPAPTSFNFLDADYDRKTGLKGDGSTKYLDSNRANNADPQDSQHLAVYETTSGSNDGARIGALGDIGIASQFNFIDRFSVWRFASRGATANGGGSIAAPFVGLSRSTSTTFSIHIDGTTTSISGSSSATTITGNYFIFNRNGGNFYSDARLSFYSIGESLDLDLLDARVSTLMSDFAAAIP
jgi:hypothetical protein